MWNGYPPYRRSGIRFFPHIIPIAFPLIFPFGIGLAFWLFHALLPVLGFLIFVAVVFFIIRMIMLGSPQAAWDSMRTTGNQWQQRFTSQQPPYYQPSTPPQQPDQPQQPYRQGYQAGEQMPYYQPTQQTPYYQPSQQAGEQTPYYQPSQQANTYYQPKANNPEEMPPAGQQ